MENLKNLNQIGSSNIEMNNLKTSLKKSNGSCQSLASCSPTMLIAGHVAPSTAKLIKSMTDAK